MLIPAVEKLSVALEPRIQRRYDVGRDDCEKQNKQNAVKVFASYGV
jgi:hypothetical protein